MMLINFLKVTELVSGTARLKSKFDSKNPCLYYSITLSYKWNVVANLTSCWAIGTTWNQKFLNLDLISYISHATLDKPSVIFTLFCKNKIINWWQLDSHKDKWWIDVTEAWTFLLLDSSTWSVKCVESESRDCVQHLICDSYIKPFQIQVWMKIIAVYN